MDRRPKTKLARKQGVACVARERPMTRQVSYSVYSAVMMVFTVAVTPSWTSTVTMWVPVVLIGSLELHLALVELQPARLAHGVDDLLRGDRPEQPAVVTRLVGDGEHGLGERAAVSSACSACCATAPARPPAGADRPRRWRPWWRAGQACAAPGSCAGSRRRRRSRRRARPSVSTGCSRIACAITGPRRREEAELPRPLDRPGQLD